MGTYLQDLKIRTRSYKNCVASKSVYAEYSNCCANIRYCETLGISKANDEIRPLMRHHMQDL